MRSSHHPLIAAMACLVAGAACKEPATHVQRPRPEALIVLPGAVAVRDQEENEGTVSYEMDEKYPAQPVIDTIRARLEGAGWRPLEEDFLNPGAQSSLVRGWASHEDRTAGQPRQIYEWAGQWGDRRERIVWYVFTYDASVAAGGEIRPEGRLKVRATVLSAESVKALRDAAGRSRKGS